MKKGDTVEKGSRPCGRKWKSFLVDSARAILCLSFLSLILAGCVSSGNKKQPAGTQAAPAAINNKPVAVPSESENTKATLVYNCQPGNGKPLTSAQASQLATLLANDKAAAFYHCQPFYCDKSAAFVDGRWLWKQTVPGDYEAIVEVAVDGSTNRVIVNLLNSTINSIP